MQYVFVALALQYEEAFSYGWPAQHTARESFLNCRKCWKSLTSNK